MTQPTCPRCGHTLVLCWQENASGFWQQIWVCDPCREAGQQTVAAALGLDVAYFRTGEIHPEEARG